MALPAPIPPGMPTETVTLARQVCSTGTVPMQVRDALGPLYTDADFADLFAPAGRPALAPARLALVCVLQFLEGLSDRQAADAVRTRIDWKYALGLPLADPGFCHTVLGDFRDRLVANQQAMRLLTRLLDQCAAAGWLHPQRQRTDATHVLAAIRSVGRTELVGETLRAALNALALAAPAWLQALAPPPWYERYLRRIETSRLPKASSDRAAWVQTVGLDGALLLAAVAVPTAPPELRTLPAVALLRQVWVQQFVSEDGVLRLRTSEELPPATQRVVSPYDAEARTGAKRDTWWDGYKVHLTETVTADGPQLITHVETAPAPEADTDALPRIQQALAATSHAPQEHLADAGYVDADLLLTSRTTHQIELIGPVPADTSWQARAGTGFAVRDFTIDWPDHHAHCPGGQTSTSWSERINHRSGTPEVLIRFAPSACRTCVHRPACTAAAVEPRTLTVRAQATHEALEAARLHQQTDAFQQVYTQRAGVEGTIAQGVRTGLRRSRYRGQAKTHLQHILLAVAINVARVVAWLADVPRATTRTSAFAALAPPTAGIVCS